MMMICLESSSKRKYIFHILTSRIFLFYSDLEAFQAFLFCAVAASDAWKTFFNGKSIS